MSFIGVGGNKELECFRVRVVGGHWGVVADLGLHDEIHLLLLLLGQFFWREVRHQLVPDGPFCIADADQLLD